MTEEKTETVSCCYCKEQINIDAKVCFHCGHNQKRYMQCFNQYVNHAATIISIFFLVVAYWQYDEAKNERVKAENALEQVQKVGKTIAKVLLVQSTLKGSINSFGVLKFFPLVMQREAESLLNAIEVNGNEQQEIYKLYDLLKEWQLLSMKSNKTPSDVSKFEIIEKKLEQLIGYHDEE